MLTQPQPAVAERGYAAGERTDAVVDLVDEFVSWPAPRDKEGSRQDAKDMRDLIEKGVRRSHI